MKSTSKIIIALVLFVLGFSVDAQNNPEILALQIEIKNITEQIAYQTKTPEGKLELAAEVTKKFEHILEYPESWNTELDTLKNFVSVLKSDDNLVKVYTWSIFFEDGTYKYFGFVQSRNHETGELTNYYLDDKSAEIDKPENKKLDHNEWFGAIYYQIVTIPDGKKTNYVLLGWDGNDNLSQKKIVEQMSFRKNGEPIFNSDFVVEENKKSNRIIFEYSKQTNMVLRYDEKYKMIIFDHLAPAERIYEGYYQYYGPDFSHDAIYFENGKWNFISEVDVRNPEKNKEENKKHRYDY